MTKLKLHWQILIAIVLATVAGTLTGTDASILGITFFSIYDFAGTLFMNALRMIIVPLIMASIIVGIASLGGSRDLGRLGGKTILYYAFSSTLAILIGLVFVNVLAPGIADGQPVGEQLNLTLDSNQVASAVASVEGRGGGDIVEIFLRMIPTKQSDALLTLWKGISETMMKITMWVMTFAPYGVFGLVAETVAATGFAAFKPLLVFFFTVLLALAAHAFIALPLVLKYVARVHPSRHFKAMAPAMLTAFSSASSSATLPLTMECVEKNAGVSERTTSFVLPLGATINMDGTALYECVAAIFLAQAYGLELSFGTQFTVVLIALLTSIGVAGIPAASLVAITVILTAIGLPVEAIGLLLVTDRVLDMCRTAVNIFSDSCGAVIIARSEKETGVLEGN